MKRLHVFYNEREYLNDFVVKIQKYLIFSIQRQCFLLLGWGFHTFAGVAVAAML